MRSGRITGHGSTSHSTRRPFRCYSNAQCIPCWLNQVLSRYLTTALCREGPSLLASLDYLTFSLFRATLRLFCGTTIPHVPRPERDRCTWARRVSSVSRAPLSSSTQIRTFTASQQRYPTTSPSWVGRLKIFYFPQYYEVAVCTILFYDYLLTLADEVRRGFTLSVLRLRTNITIRRSNISGRERNRGVRIPQKNIGLAIYLFPAAFWLFIFVGLIDSAWIAPFLIEFQNRYFPMTIHFWQFFG